MSTVNEQANSSGNGPASRMTRDFDVNQFDKVSTSINGTIRVSIGATPSLTIRAEEGAIGAIDAVDVAVRDSTLILKPKRNWSGSSGVARSLAAQLLDQILKRRGSGDREPSIGVAAPYTVEVTTPRLRELVVGGSARVALESDVHDDESFKLSCHGTTGVSTKNVSAPSVYFASSGTASLQVNEVSSDSFDCRISGTATIRAKGEATRASARLSGAGSLHATELLTSQATFTMSGATNATINAQKVLEVKSSGACSVRYLGDPKTSTKFSGVLDCSPLQAQEKSV